MEETIDGEEGGGGVQLYKYEGIIISTIVGEGMRRLRAR